MVTIKTGTLFGVGLGPGDPELLTLKAARIIGSGPVLAYFAKAGRRGNAREIVDSHIGAETVELPLSYPVTTEIPFADPEYVDLLARFYEESAAALAAHLEAGRDVVLIAEGDPLLYGSFMHLFERLRDRFPVEIVPGVPGMAGCWAAARLPMTWGDDILTVLPATLDEESLVDHLRMTDAVVIMKLGTNMPKVKRALAAAGMLARAVLVERGTMARERVVRVEEAGDGPVPYFAVVLVAGEGRRP
jgi:precorrin-2/cobalt-factor-2 C20-methyltransferase